MGPRRRCDGGRSRTRKSTGEYLLGAADIRAQRAQPRFDAFIAAVHHLGLLDDSGAFGAQGSDDQRHAGADVRAGNVLGAEFGRAADHHAVRIALHKRGAHFQQSVHKIHPAFEQFFKK